MEAQLDRAAALTPNAGRVASHRLNRGEYVNAIHDMLALDINGAELLPGDMAGFGFDNNADVLPSRRDSCPLHLGGHQDQPPRDRKSGEPSDHAGV
jgi:hypothetical protein